jgi:hypothetical protein
LIPTRQFQWIEEIKEKIQGARRYISHNECCVSCKSNVLLETILSWSLKGWLCQNSKVCGMIRYPPHILGRGRSTQFNTRFKKLWKSRKLFQITNYRLLFCKLLAIVWIFLLTDRDLIFFHFDLNKLQKFVTLCEFKSNKRKLIIFSIKSLLMCDGWQSQWDKSKPLGRELKYWSLSSSVVFSAIPSILIARWSSFQYMETATFGFSEISRLSQQNVKSCIFGIENQWSSSIPFSTHIISNKHKTSMIERF